MSRKLEGKVALVTGAGRGIGRGIALVLASRGAAVAASDIDETTARDTARAIQEQGGESTAVRGDVASQQSMNEVAAAALDRYGAIDICVANAGVIGASGYEDRTEFTAADWDVTYNVNVRGMVHTAMAVIPHMKEKRSGKVVNIASHGGRTPRGGAGALTSIQIPYSVSKAAAIQWTQLLALQLAPYGINVNCVCPGTLWTPMWERIAINKKRTDPSLSHLTPFEIYERFVAGRTPLGRGQTPEHIGRAVAFFASDDARIITGQALNVNGGAVFN